MKINFGVLITFVLLGITLGLWVLSKPTGYDFWSNSERTSTQLMALLSLVLMSLSLILSTRMKWLENLFGGLDRVYDFHKYIGALAFLAAVDHLLILVVAALPDLAKATAYLIPGKRIPFNFGISAIYTMLLSFVFIGLIRLPYEKWRVTHRLLGLSFLLAGIHGVLAASDVAAFLPLKIWIIGIIALGGISGLYTIFVYDKWGPRYIYEVEKVVKTGDVVSISMKNFSRKLEYKPGQFAYFVFEDPKLRREVHPFSISSAPNEEYLRISAKILGDFTVTLNSLDKGTKVVVYGPYGEFGKAVWQKNSDELIYIAGGIGVAPFLSMLKSQMSVERKNKTIFYYVVRNKEEAVFAEEIENLFPNEEWLQYRLWISKDKGRLTAVKVLADYRSIKKLQVNICGPTLMMESLEKQFIECGMPNNKVRIESFSLN